MPRHVPRPRSGGTARAGRARVQHRCGPWGGRERRPVPQARRRVQQPARRRFHRGHRRERRQRWQRRGPRGRRLPPGRCRPRGLARDHGRRREAPGQEPRAPLATPTGTWARPEPRVAAGPRRPAAPRAAPRGARPGTGTPRGSASRPGPAARSGPATHPEAAGLPEPGTRSGTGARSASGVAARWRAGRPWAGPRALAFCPRWRLGDRDQDHHEQRGQEYHEPHHHRCAHGVTQCLL